MRLFKLIPESNQKGTYFDELKYVSDSLFIGKTLPDFIQSDTSGVDIKLSKFRGKYVLVDFWASWCIPCRAENPHLVTAIQKYPNKDLEIISVSLDDKAAPWMAAIKKDGIQMWKHTSDLEGWNNRVAIKHRIRSVPANFLVDPNGKIIAKNLRGKEVLDVLEKIIPKP